MSSTSVRRTTRLPSRAYVKPEKRSAPIAKRTDEYASGCQPCVSAYLTTVKLKLQKRTVTSRRTSAGMRWRTGAKASAAASGQNGQLTERRLGRIVEDGRARRPRKSPKGRNRR